MCSQVAAYRAADSQAAAQQAACLHSAACAVWVHNLQCHLLTLCSAAHCMLTLCSAAHCMLTGCSAAHCSLTLRSSALTRAPLHSFAMGSRSYACRSTTDLWPFIIGAILYYASFILSRGVLYNLIHLIMISTFIDYSLTVRLIKVYCTLTFKRQCVLVFSLVVW